MPATQSAQVLEHPTRERLRPVPLPGNEPVTVWTPTANQADRAARIKRLEADADERESTCAMLQREANEARAIAKALRHEPSWEG